MSENFYSIITDRGAELINEALSKGEKIDLSFIAVGDSNGEYYEPQSNQTELINEKYRTNIAEVTELTAKGLIPTDIGGFYIREIGIFDNRNNLILIAKQPETYKPIENEGSTKELWIKVTIKAISSHTEKFYLDHWNRYVETCKQFDILNMIVKPIPKRSTFVSIGNANVKIMQTVSKKSGFVSSELYITDKNIYDLLFDQKEKIEKQVGELEWLRLDDKKASRIVKYFNIDVETDPERAAQEHIRSAQSLKEIYQKYIAPFYKKSICHILPF